jgi:hypothetical protein
MIPPLQKQVTRIPILSIPLVHRRLRLPCTAVPPLLQLLPPKSLSTPVSSLSHVIGGYSPSGSVCRCSARALSWRRVLGMLELENGRLGPGSDAGAGWRPHRTEEEAGHGRWVSTGADDGRLRLLQGAHQPGDPRRARATPSSTGADDGRLQLLQGAHQPGDPRRAHAAPSRRQQLGRVRPSGQALYYWGLGILETR